MAPQTQVTCVALIVSYLPHSDCGLHISPVKFTVSYSVSFIALGLLHRNPSRHPIPSSLRAFELHNPPSSTLLKKFPSITAAF